MADTIRFLANFYNLSSETAAELVTELGDLKSLQSLADYRVARAVPAPTPPKDL